MNQTETVAVVNTMFEDITRRVLRSLPNFPEHWTDAHVRACVWLAVNRYFMDLRGPIREIRKSPVYPKLSI